MAGMSGPGRDSVKLEVGALCAVVPDSMLFCFDLVTEGTVADGAGAGKTTLLERTIREFGTERPVAVIEGDQESIRKPWPPTDECTEAGA